MLYIVGYTSCYTRYRCVDISARQTKGDERRGEGKERERGREGEGEGKGRRARGEGGSWKLW